ncbi:hypothetical protein BDN71DRAFT_1495466 [Pleurotus eryngii]|uniref:MYND-type domain-containing protein n=1 Tax=Pleurotus eryngii TaxID=5323 RepID=A0A9P5ZXC4_PLEER|nr:hypothetical protein BDN71DRAFT_1495466 [Pleurotus eryngii]
MIPAASSGQETSVRQECKKLSFQALQTAHSGNHCAAEQLYLHIVRTKTYVFGAQSVETAASHNALGELYVKMNRLAEAEFEFMTAVGIRSRAGPDHVFDAAVSRENLAQVYEMTRRTPAAKNMRLLGAPNKILCAYYYCPRAVLSIGQLATCGQCKAVFYCSDACQLKDWKPRHKRYCKPM